MRLGGREWAPSSERSELMAPRAPEAATPLARLPGSSATHPGQSEAELVPRQPGGETGSGTSPGGHCRSYRWEPGALPACCTE